MINIKDYYYVSCVIINLLVILILTDTLEIKTNKYTDILFYILLLLVYNIDIKFSILLTFLYLVTKIKDNDKEDI
jgi:hypothetical protein